MEMIIAQELNLKGGVSCCYLCKILPLYLQSFLQPQNPLH